LYPCINLSRHYRFLITVVLLIPAGNLYGQLDISVGEQFMSTQSIKELHVCVEDHSVWVTNAAGKVYVKKATDTDFQLYPATAALTVSAITGFNTEEMYFVVGLQVLKITAGTPVYMSLPFAGVTKINDITVVLGKGDENLWNSGVSYKDYLSVATNKDLYFSFRGSSTISLPYNPGNPYYFQELDFRIGYDGFKHQVYRYLHPTSYCGVEGYHENDMIVAGLFYWSRLPEKPPYYAKINSSIPAIHHSGPIIGSSVEIFYNIWATDDGVYGRKLYACMDQATNKYLPGEQVNTLEKVYALTPIRKQDFIFAGSNTGIFYTKKSIFPGPNELSSLDLLKFDRLSGFPNVQVNVLKVATEVQQAYRFGQRRYDILCEKVVWAATERGVYKLNLTLNQDQYNDMRIGDFGYSKPITNNNFQNPIFQLCGNETVTVNARIPASFSSQVLYQWFKDGVEIPQFRGDLEVNLSGSGVYTAKITSLCEQITINSIPITVQRGALPSVEFNHPPEIKLCQNQSVTLRTKQDATYAYRWYKDGNLIPGEGRSTYNALAEGEYYVEVSNCSGQYTASSKTKLSITTLVKPIILPDKPSYCVGDAAVLSTTNPQSLQIRWKIAGTELPQFNNQMSITPQEDGRYTATVIGENGCDIQSDAYNFVRHPFPSAVITRSSNKSLCDGESVKLSASLTAGATYVWNTGSIDREIDVTEAGFYSVIVTSAGGCPIQSSEVEVKFGNTLTLPHPEDGKICTIGGERVALVAEEGYASYTWNGKRGFSNTLMVDAPGSYTLEVEDENGCKASTIYNVLPSCDTVTAPNAFSPNGDGINDIWNVHGLQGDPKAQIKIFNRYGTLIYSTSGETPYWDGYIINGPAPVAVYYYLIYSKYNDKPINGTITLIR
jgi:gliding motility-associated-like protein